MTAIEWSDETWNPVTGCDRVSPGCAHCYALDLAARLKGMGQARYQRDGDPKTSGPGFGVTLHPDKLEGPLRWRKPRMVFVNSMSDLFHEAIPDEYIADVFTVMRRAEQHTFQVLTKRPERMLDVMERLAWRSPTTDEREDDELPPFRRSGHQAHVLERGVAESLTRHLGNAYICPNVWLGVSIENRRFVHRADLLRQTPVAVRFISAEPLLGPLVQHVRRYENGFGHRVEEGVIEPWTTLDLTDIDWLIVGGESGPKARPMKPEWVRDLRDACLACCPLHPLGLCSGEADCTRRPAFFFKQWGGRTPKAGGRELDGRTWDEMPARVKR